MPFSACWLPDADAAYCALREAALAAHEHRLKEGRGKTSKQEGLFKQLVKCLTLLLENPRHPGLQTHEFHAIPHPYSPKDKVFEAYVQNRTPGAYRLFWCYGPGKGEVTIIAITPHP